MLPAAGKTGTTNDYNDAWFVGFTPKLVTGVDRLRPAEDDHPQRLRSGDRGAVLGQLHESRDPRRQARAARGPASVTSANVCRISASCRTAAAIYVEVINREGMVETRSMIYTEYFVKGTQPTTVCPLHESRSFMDAIAGVFGKDSGPPPMPVGATGFRSPQHPNAQQRAGGAAASGHDCGSARRGARGPEETRVLVACPRRRWRRQEPKKTARRKRSGGARNRRRRRGAKEENPAAGDTMPRTRPCHSVILPGIATRSDGARSRRGLCLQA